MKSPFDNEAHYYDIFHRDKDYISEAERIRAEFPDAKTILEIGCGTGNLTKKLEILGFEITCLEPSGEMLKYFKGKKSKVIQTTIQDYEPPKGKFDLVLATYDTLNYVPHNDYCEVVSKILEMAKDVYTEVWDKTKSVRCFTYKWVNGCSRLRLGFRVMDKVYLWYIFWGNGLVLSHHRLYLR